MKITCNVTRIPKFVHDTIPKEIMVVMMEAKVSTQYKHAGMIKENYGSAEQNECMTEG